MSRAIRSNADSWNTSPGTRTLGGIIRNSPSRNGRAMPEPRLVEDGWLAAHLGKPCFHLTGDLGRMGGCSHELAAKLGEASVFVDAKVDVSYTSPLRALQSSGFQLIETTV